MYQALKVLTFLIKYDKTSNNRCVERGWVYKTAVTYENGVIFQHFEYINQFKIYKIEEKRINTNGKSV